LGTDVLVAEGSMIVGVAVIWTGVNVEAG